MAIQTIATISNSAQLNDDYQGNLAIMKFYVCDTEAELPAPAWGSFAVVKETILGGPPSNPQSRHYFYVGTDTEWKRAELEAIDD